MKKTMVVVFVGTVCTAMLCAGCRFSKVKADAPVHISGRAVTANGAPLAGAQVRLFKEADLGEALVGITLAVGSLGAICLLPGAPAVCHQGRTVTTSSNGSYAFDIKGADTQGLIGTEATLDVVVAGPPTGSSTTISFKARNSTVVLPDARLWDAGARVTESGGHINVAWTSLSAAYGSKATYSAQLFDSQRQAPMWSQSAKGGNAAIDARVLEDKTATAAVAAHTDLSGTGAASVHGNYLSAPRAVKPLAGPPPSRSKGCAAVIGTATMTAYPQAKCAATDGDFVSPARLTAPNAKLVTGVAIDLGSVRHINLVVARGLASTFLIELSNDGRTYHQVDIGNGSVDAVSPPGDPSARFVRLRSPSGLDESLLYEVSIWSS